MLIARRQLLGGGLGFAGGDAGGQDADLVEDAHRQGHQRLVEDIRRGGQDGGDDEVREDGVLPVPGQELVMRDALNNEGRP